MSPEMVRPPPHQGPLLHRNSFDGRPCCRAPTAWLPSACHDDVALWHGYLALGALTLLCGRCKSAKRLTPIRGGDRLFWSARGID